jgi:hypothetical protein
MIQLEIGTTGNGKRFCKFSAMVGRWFVRGADGEIEEVQLRTFVADFDNMATGSMRFMQGQKPERVMDSTIHGKAPDPGEGFKRGFVLMVYSPTFGGAVEFASNATIVCNAIKPLYRQWLAGKASNPGKLPVIASKGVKAVKSARGTNHCPVLVIEGWVDRPAELPDVSPVEVSEIWQGDTASSDPPF